MRPNLQLEPPPVVEAEVFTMQINNRDGISAWRGKFYKKSTST
jgi:hypothetical protein